MISKELCRRKRNVFVVRSTAVPYYRIGSVRRRGINATVLSDRDFLSYLPAYKRGYSSRLCGLYDFPQAGVGVRRSVTELAQLPLSVNPN